MTSSLRYSTWPYFQVYRRIDPEKNASWWTDIYTIVNDELKKLVDDVRTTNSRESVHNSVQKDVIKIFKVFFFTFSIFYLFCWMISSVIFHLSSTTFAFFYYVSFFIWKIIAQILYIINFLVLHLPIFVLSSTFSFPKFCFYYLFSNMHIFLWIIFSIFILFLFFTIFQFLDKGFMNIILSKSG